MNVEKAKHIYEVSRQENIPVDIILAMEGLDRQEYEDALSIYIKTLNKVQETLGFDVDWNDEPRQYECYYGRYMPENLLW